MKISRKEALFLCLLMGLAFLFRWSLVRGNYFHFYFDQARDATISRSILENKDLKIQGPSASGTNDIVYHGVLYYYLIGPVYTLSQGSPLAVTLFLCWLNSLTIIPLYLLAKTMFNSSWLGYLAGWLYAFSLDAAEVGSCLSNPALATLTIPWLYLLAYQTFFKNKSKYLPWLALTLGLTNQFAIWTVYLFIPLLLFYLFRAVKTKTLISSLLIYLFSIASLIITQFKLYQAGIFTNEAVSNQLQGNITRASQLTRVIQPYLDKISYSVFPVWPSLSLIVCLLITIYFILKLKFRPPVFFFLVWFLSPILLFFRTFYYMLAGTLAVIYLLLAFSLWQLRKNRVGQILIGMFLIAFTLANFLGLKKSRSQEYTYVVNIQKGAYLFRQLALIDQTYQIAAGREFSISSLTSPYKYNTTWAYLYSWYGQKKYGYLPFWFGPDQAGLPAAELLTRIDKPQPVHFSIYEPDPGWLYIFIPEFNEEQTSWAGPVVDNYQFGNLKLESRLGNLF